MRVRTYCFPGCFTRPPGTSTRDHPREPTASKPVVPGDVARPSLASRGRRAPPSATSCAAATAAGDTGLREPATVPTPPTRALVSRGVGQRKRRGPGPLEEPTPSGPKAFPRRWRGLTPQWPRSLRLGSASGFKVAAARPRCKCFETPIPHFPGKASGTPALALASRRRG